MGYIPIKGLKMLKILHTIKIKILFQSFPALF